MRRGNSYTLSFASSIGQVILAFDFHAAALHVLDDLWRDALQESLVPMFDASQSVRMGMLLSTGIDKKAYLPTSVMVFLVRFHRG